MLPGPRKFQDPMSQSDFEELDIRLPESLSSEKDLTQAFQYFISRYSLALNVIKYKYGFKARQRALLCMYSILLFYQNHSESSASLDGEIKEVLFSLPAGAAGMS